ncbi:alpha-amylase [Aquimarina sp. AD10]|uniref:alpha-amylase n=1 Tax=Aquimarina sp. AD10 TaxID=1714849 RepID=UPI000E4685CA|nr:alpha-amylase [Aquimarina sp. AD10]AXT58812.1 alpha-amylase [Aquimarina sp. AD10]RKM99712.1 alpha-amylase [Aquimarina sp. AD10]
MKKIINISTKTILLLGGLVFGLTGCSDDDDSSNTTETIVTSQSLKMDLNQFKREDAGIFMQAFYWDVEPRGAWYDEVSKSIEDWAASGIDRIWLAPPGKGASGGFSMGYDPSDYFDVGDFDQHGTVETRFGSRQELENLIQKSHDNGLEVIADIVMGHNSGGGKQANPFRGGDEVFSLFNEANGNASGKFNRTNEHFHPNDIHEKDEQDLFFAETDLCHDQQYVQDWFWGRDDSVASFYKNTLGFDGWRFDYVKSFGAQWVKAWNDKIGGFSVGENFDGNEQVLKDWVDASGSPAFDFACFYRLDETLDRNKDLTALGDAGNMLRKLDPAMAVTFTANHDTEKDENPDNRISYGNKLLAYSYILTHDGYPTIFYLDYEAFKGQLKTLMEINSTLAAGDIEILEASKDEYIMKRGGNGTNPGLILYMNISKQPKERVVKTNWINKKLVDYTDNTRLTPTTDAEGNTTIYAPAGGYAIWSITK